MVYRRYGGSTTNGATKAGWKDKRLMSIKSAKLGTFIGGLVHTIETRGEDHMQSYTSKERLQQIYFFSYHKGGDMV